MWVSGLTVLKTITYFMVTAKEVTTVTTSSHHVMQTEWVPIQRSGNCREYLTLDQPKSLAMVFNLFF